MGCLGRLNCDPKTVGACRSFADRASQRNNAGQRGLMANGDRQDKDSHDAKSRHASEVAVIASENLFLPAQIPERTEIGDQEYEPVLTLITDRPK